MISEGSRQLFEILTSRLQGYTRSTPIVSYVADGIELLIDERGCDERGCLDYSSVQIVYLRRGCIRLDCMLWKYSTASDLDGLDDILDLLLEDSHPILVRE